MPRFVYFEYHGTLPRTARFGHTPASYHYILEVSKKGWDGRDRIPEKLLRAAGILLRNALSEDVADALINGPPPKEITQQRFDAIRKTSIMPSSTIPGGIYQVTD